MSISLSNEDLPLSCYLPPKVSHDFNIVTCIYMGTIGVLLWDVLNNLRNDYRILFYYKFGLQTGIYIITRLGILAYAFGRAVMLTRPVEDCEKIETTLNALMTVFVSATTLAFYLRIYAIYWDNIFVKVIYGVMWLGTAAAAIIFTQSFSVEHPGSTGYCIDSLRGTRLGASTTALLINDTLVYFAITYRLYTLFRDSESTVQQRMKMVMLGASLPIFSKVVLLDSQLYFLVIVTIKAALSITVYVLDTPMNVAFVICILVLVNILAGRIFRTIKTGNDRFEKPSPTSRIGTGMKFAARTNVSSITDRTSTGAGYSHTIDITKLESDMSHVDMSHTLASSGNNGFNNDESAKEGALYENHPWIV